MPDGAHPERAAADKAAAGLTALLAAAAVLAVFAPTLGFSFLSWDDYKLLHDNLNIQALTWPHLRWMFTTFRMGPYQPLSWLSYALDYALWGENAAGYHLLNNLIHAANAALFCLLSLELMDRVRPRDRELPRLAGALLAALVFALHPLRVECVAWVTERREVLSGFFYLLCVLLYVKAAAKSSRGLLGASFAAYVLSLLAKAAAFTLPGVLLILDLYPLRRLPPGPSRWRDQECRPVWLEKLLFLIPAAAAAALAYAGQVSAGTLVPMRLFGLKDRVIEAAWGIGFYPFRTVWPFRLSPLYETGPDLSAYLPAAALSAVVLISITAVLLARRRRFPSGLAAWSFYLLTILPLSGFVSFGVQLAADRYSYLSCMGFAVLAGAALRLALSSENRLAAASAWTASLFLAGGLTFLTRRQLPVWKNTESLWRHVLALDPDSLVARNNLGEELAHQGRLSEAEGQFRAALLLNPALPMTLNNLGNALADQGKYPEALKDFDTALRSDPRHLPSWVNECRLLQQMGRPAQAEAACAKALELVPDFPPAQALLQQIHGSRKRS